MGAQYTAHCWPTVNVSVDPRAISEAKEGTAGCGLIRSTYLQDRYANLYPTGSGAAAAPPTPQNFAKSSILRFICLHFPCCRPFLRFRSVATQSYELRTPVPTDAAS